MDIEDIFLDMFRTHIDALRDRSMPKGKFIAVYIQELKKTDKDSADRYKAPQVIQVIGDPKNNWLDYMLDLDDDTYENFKQAIKQI